MTRRQGFVSSSQGRRYCYCYCYEKVPSSSSKLLVKWQGPYLVVRKIGPITYEIHHPDKRKTFQTYHVSLLKEWKELPSKTPETALLIR